MNEPNTTTTPAKEESILDKLHKEWELGGKRKPDKKEATRLIGEWKKANDAKAKAAEALDAARKAEHTAVEAIVKARGRGRFQTPDGQSLTPMSKEGSLFMRREGGNLDTFG